MTFEEAKKIFLNRGIDDNGIYDGDKWRKSVRVISDYLENLPSAEMTDMDSISRQAVNTLIDELARAISDERCCISRGRSTATIMRDIYHLPPVTPQPKTGHWEWVQYDGNPNIGNWHCSECNRIVCGAITAVSPVYAYKYCPSCGADMRGDTKC